MWILCHAQIDVTMNIYTEVPDAKTLRALKRLGKQLGDQAVAVLCCCTAPEPAFSRIPVGL
jgi:hypothetical protein